MKQRFAPLALMLTWTGLLVAYWPAACTQQTPVVSRPDPAATAPDGLRSPDQLSHAQSPQTGAPQAGQPQDGQPSGAPPSTPQSSILPHPAFAFADEMGGKNVTIADIAERATPSVVNVASRRVVKERPQEDPFFRHFFGPSNPEPQERHQGGLGSGVIYSSDGLILTNNHVIEGADEITVTTADGTDYDAEVAGTDEKSDVALLRLKGKVKDLVPIAVGDSTKLRVGDVVLAIGSPFGFSQTVTMGIVSAKGRQEPGIVDYADFIQTDAAINPGNSGGALVNMAGELVGINTAIISRTGGYQGIGFAIPSNMAREIAQSLLEHGRVIRGWLGIGIQDVDAEMASAMGLTSTSGVLVSDIEPGSPAEKAGLARGDVVLTVDGKKTTSSTQLRNLIAAAGANKKVAVAILRNGKPLTVNVLLGELKGDKPEPPHAAAPHDTSPEGLTLEPLSPHLRQRLNLPASVKQGVVVTGVAPDSRAADRGIAPGDVILEVNRKAVNSVQEFESAYKQSTGKGALLLVFRDGRTHYLVLTR
jgi:serine protease Do